MKTVETLPENYRKHFTLNLQKNKKDALLVNLFSLLIAAALIVPMCFFHSPLELLDLSRGFGVYFLKLGVLVVGLVAYIFLHEMVHGIAMKRLGCHKVHYGFTGLYAYAGSEDYFGKKNYRIIALAPVVVWGVVLAVLNVLVPTEWFWVVYWIQISNLSGAAGDFYVSWKFRKLPDDILVQDTGVEMTVFVPQEKGSE